MLGRRNPQRGLFEADHLYGGMVSANSFYGFLAAQRGAIFRDEEFAGLYAGKRGRPSVPPSLLATALLLQAHDKVSDEEAKGRAEFDLRWKVALGIPVEERPFAKSTLQLFRAQLVLHEEGAAILKKSLQVAKGRGYFRGRKLRVAVDTTPILGRGAVKDTYNLLADGIARLVRVMAALAGERPQAWAAAHQLGRYFGSSIKGEAEVAWDDAAGRRAFLAGIVGDADRLLAVTRELLSGYAEGSVQAERLRAAAELLSALLLQDVGREEAGPVVREGTAKGRIISVHDPEMRHGHKSSSRRFDGYKGALAVDTESQLITAVDILPANAGDGQDALELVEASEANTEVAVETTIGDCAYGGGELRQRFVEQGRRLVAKVPVQTNRGYYTRELFQFDLTRQHCTCPAGQTTTDRGQTKRGRLQFRFPAAACGPCPLRTSCTPARARVVSLHPQEALLQEARASQSTPGGRAILRQRQAVEHRIARLVQLGARQARYFGSAKTLFQLFLVAAVANLTLVALSGLTGDVFDPQSPSRASSTAALALLGAFIVAVWSTGGIVRSAALLSPLRSCQRPSPALMAVYRPDF